MKKRMVVFGLAVICTLSFAGCSMKVNSVTLRTGSGSGSDSTLYGAKNNVDDEDEDYGYSSFGTDDADDDSASDSDTNYSYDDSDYDWDDDSDYEYTQSADDITAEKLEDEIEDFVEDLVKKNKEDSQVIKDLDKLYWEDIDLAELDKYSNNEFIEELSKFIKENKLSTECEDSNYYFNMYISGSYSYGYSVYVDAYWK